MKLNYQAEIMGYFFFFKKKLQTATLKKKKSNYMIARHQANEVPLCFITKAGQIQFS